MARTVIQGTPGDDTLNGTPGDDTIFGGAGVDIMSGGARNDFYYVENAGDQVLEAVGGGRDAIFTTISYTLAAGQEIEGLVPQSRRSTDGLVLVGNEFRNGITGTLGNDMLSGGAGDDLLDARAGTDTLDGGTGDDVLRAGIGADTLNGGEGDDRLWGSNDSDTMAGGAGDDIYYVIGTGTSVTEDVGGGRDTLVISRNYTLAAGLEIEVLRPAYYSDTELILTGNEFDNYLVGGRRNDTLVGGAGFDRLDGGGGANVLTGGAGADIYFVRSTGDVVNEDVGGIIYSFIDYTLAAGLEIETLRVATNSAAGLALTGNEFDNQLIGGEGSNALSGGGGDDRLDGGAGADTMAGGAGNDIYHVDIAGDVVNEVAGEGNDTVYATADFALAAGADVEVLRVLGGAGLILTGSSSNNYIIGGAGDDTLNGGDGADMLTAGLGRDVVAGGSGADLFAFHDGDFGGSTTSTADRILDFNAAQGDRIHLGSVDAKSGTPANDAFSFIGAASFSGMAGQLRTFQHAGDTFFAGDLNGDSSADFMVRVVGSHTLTAGNFVL